jgi:hypothetical protein
LALPLAAVFDSIRSALSQAPPSRTGGTGAGSTNSHRAGGGSCRSGRRSLRHTSTLLEEIACGAAGTCRGSRAARSRTAAGNIEEGIQLAGRGTAAARPRGRCTRSRTSARRRSTGPRNPGTRPRRRTRSGRGTGSTGRRWRESAAAAASSATTATASSTAAAAAGEDLELHGQRNQTYDEQNNRDALHDGTFTEWLLMVGSKLRQAY